MSAAPMNTTAAPAANGKPRPIAFPQRERVDEICRQRANGDNARWAAQVERRDALITSAAAAGREEGERAGYTAGWHWGLVCGTCAGAIAVATLWIVWAPLQQLLASWGLA